MDVTEHIGTLLYQSMLTISGFIGIYVAIRSIHKSVNSKMDALLETTRQHADQIGYLRGRADGLTAQIEARKEDVPHG